MHKELILDTLKISENIFNVSTGNNIFEIFCDSDPINKIIKYSLSEKFESDGIMNGNVLLINKEFVIISNGGLLIKINGKYEFKENDNVTFYYSIE